MDNQSASKLGPIVRENLYRGPAPEALGDHLLDQPAISIHLPVAESANGAAVVIAPGGGYRSLAADYEGLQVARWFNRCGIAAFVLRYRLAPAYHSRVSIADGMRAMRYLREHSKRFSIDPQRIGIIGFSAGGHLALSVATRSGGSPQQERHEPLHDDADSLFQHSARPDFAAGVYAVTNGAVRGKKADEYTPTDTAVGPTTPPTFLMHTHEDSIVPASQSTLHYNALLRAKVPAELHIFNDGDHGLGLAVGDPDVAHWTGLLHRWLRRRGFLVAQQRIEVVGQLLIDGEAPAVAWVTLRPENTNAPIARVRVGGVASRADGGKFLIPRAEGPVSGVYLVEVHQVSAQHEASATGEYSLQDSRIFSKKVTLKKGQPLNLHLSANVFVEREDL